MSTAKRSRRRQSETQAASPPPAAKRVKTTVSSHVPAQNGLAFLVDENTRHGKKLDAKLTNGVPTSGTTRVDESHAVVASDTRAQDEPDAVGLSADNAIGISSAEEESASEDEADDEDEEDLASAALDVQKSRAGLTNGHIASEREDKDAEAGAEDVEMEEADEEQVEGDGRGEEPSFGDMLQARHSGPIDVQSTFPDLAEGRNALVSTSDGRMLAAPSSASLGVVLAQALKTNDKDLLESCLHTADRGTIHTTIQRLSSRNVATLLQRLAERMHKRPGRTGSLLTWIQWSLISHGGYLATQPELMKKLKSLQRVLRERASGLQPLLHLKGKLDMLSAQLELRRNLQEASRAANADDEDNDDAVIYIEGQDEDWSDSEDVDDALQPSRSTAKALSSKPKLQTATPRTDGSDPSDSDDEQPNGVIQEADDESSAADEEEDEDEVGVLDIEAEESSNDGESDEAADSDEEADSASASEEDDDADDDSSSNESEASGVRPPQLKSLERKR